MLVPRDQGLMGYAFKLSASAYQSMMDISGDCHWVLERNQAVLCNQGVPIESSDIVAGQIGMRVYQDVG